MGSKRSGSKNGQLQRLLTVLIISIFGFVIYFSMKSIADVQVKSSAAVPLLRARPVEDVGKVRPELLSSKPDFPDIPPDPVVPAIVKSVSVTKANTAPVVRTVPVAAVQAGLPKEAFETVLLVVASPNRPEYLKRTLSHVLKYHPRSSIPVLLSEDGQSPAVKAVVEEMLPIFRSQAHKDIPFVHIHNPSGGKPAENGYFALSRHFKWALDKVFTADWINPRLPIAVSRVIILEEDLEIAPDFFNYFEAMAPILDSDPTLMAVSAWNDNGLGKFVADERQIYRSDFFPGLGWMMTRRVWEEWGPKWPAAYWDDWIREPPQRKGRQVLRPEVCRTFHFGKTGVSNQQFHVFTDDIKLNDSPVDFKALDLSYLEEKTWEEEYLRKVKLALRVDPVKFRPGDYSPYTELRVEYDHLSKGLSSFEIIARRFGIMDNIKAGVPRTAYRGVVSFWFTELLKIHIAPSQLFAEAH